MANVNIEPVNYRAKYEQALRELDLLERFVALLIDKLGGEVVFKSTDFVDHLQQEGNYIISVEEDKEEDKVYNTRRYKVKRI